jgi:ADP-dependent NAD(P)H-hydrate dehydratase / NAD(P)H-hydrate epimerase
MKILTAEEMGAADRRSVESGVPVARLMECAGVAVARFCLRRFPDDGLVVVLAGKGNNGGDGLVAARHLAQAGRRVRVALLGAASELKGEAAAAWQSAAHHTTPTDTERPLGARLSDDETVPPKRAKTARVGPGVAKMGHPVGVEWCEVCDEGGLRAALVGAALVIDAVVGTGFKPPLRGLAAAGQSLLEGMKVPVVAVDLPSGWDADSVEKTVQGAFRADAVVTFAAPKLAHVFGHLTAGRTFGPVVVASIGTPESAVQSATGLSWCGSAKAIAETPRGINGNKGKFGHVLVVGGAFGKAGAPSMASVAAMRAGAGLVTAAVPREILPIVAAVAPELMLTPLATEGSGGLALEALEEEPLTELLKGMTVVGIGPGLGQEGTTPEWVRTFVERVTLPMVIDADALNALAGRTALLRDAMKKAQAKGRARTIVLTPHPGEMARLVGMTVAGVEADRVGLARRFATEHGVTLVLKGWRTLVAHPDGSVAVNTTGNPSMAKGGSGDILTGIVSAMLAQYPDDVARAVEAAVFLHGLAGDFACLAQDEHTVLAMDTVGHLWQAFRARVMDEDGLTWIAGTAANEMFADGEELQVSPLRIAENAMLRSR